MVYREVAVALPRDDVFEVRVSTRPVVMFALVAERLVVEALVIVALVEARLVEVAWEVDREVAVVVASVDVPVTVSVSVKSEVMREVRILADEAKKLVDVALRKVTYSP